MVRYILWCRIPQLDRLRAEVHYAPAVPAQEHGGDADLQLAALHVAHQPVERAVVLLAVQVHLPQVVPAHVLSGHI